MVVDKQAVPGLSFNEEEASSVSSRESFNLKHEVKERTVRCLMKQLLKRPGNDAYATLWAETNEDTP